MAMAEKESSQLKAEIAALKLQLDEARNVQGSDVAKLMIHCDEAKSRELVQIELTVTLSKKLKESESTILKLKEERDENQSEIQHLKAQAMALAAVMSSQTVKGEGNMGAAVVLAPSRSAGVQTRERETWRTWVVFLSYILISSKDQAKTVDCGTDALDRSFWQRDAETMTSVILLRNLSEEERFWNQVLEKAEKETKVMAIRGNRMPLQKLLAIISNIYSKKICDDEMDDRDRSPRQSFAGAFVEFTHLVANVLMHIRARPETNMDAVKVAMTKCLPTDEDTSRPSAHPRVLLFARFLGLRHESLGPLPLEGLNLYLSLLCHTQILVNLAQFQHAIEITFSVERHVFRESIKVALKDSNKAQNEINIDASLAFVLDQWEENQKKWETRLSALFVSIDPKNDGNITFEAFQEVMKRLADEKNFPTYRKRMRMFVRMCAHQRVDSLIFAEECRAIGLNGFALGTFKDHDFTIRSQVLSSANLDPAEDMDDFNETSENQSNAKMDKAEQFRALASRYKWAQGTIGKTVKELQAEGKENELVIKWNTLEKIMEEQMDPNIAQAFLNSVTLHRSGLQALQTDNIEDNRNDDNGSDGEETLGDGADALASLRPGAMRSTRTTSAASASFRSGEQSEGVQRASGSPLRRAAIVTAAAMSVSGSVTSVRPSLRANSSSFRSPTADLRAESDPAAAGKPGAWRAPATAAAAAAARSGQRFLRSTAFSSTFAVAIETPQNETAATRTSRRLAAPNSPSPGSPATIGGEQSDFPSPGATAAVHPSRSSAIPRSKSTADFG